MFDFLDQLGFGSFEMPKFDLGSLFGSAEAGPSIGDRFGLGLLDSNQWDVASTPFKGMEMRYSDAFKGLQGAQDYLAPLEHYDFARDAARSNPFSGAFAAGSSVPYNAFKMMPGPLREIPKLFGTGGALTSSASLADPLWSAAGAVKGASEWASDVAMPKIDAILGAAKNGGKSLGTFDKVFK